MKGTINKKLEFKAESDEIVVGYADADWASDTTDRKSVSGFIFKVFGCTVSWSSRKQQTVATSSSEAEYVVCGIRGHMVEGFASRFKNIK